MLFKHYLANMRIAEKVAIGKSQDILRNVPSFLQNIKKKLYGIFLIFKRSSKHTVYPILKFLAQINDFNV